MSTVFPGGCGAPSVTQPAAPARHRVGDVENGAADGVDDHVEAAWRGRVVRPFLAPGRQERRGRGRSPAAWAWPVAVTRPSKMAGAADDAMPDADAASRQRHGNDGALSSLSRGPLRGGRVRG
jgi:hypothetical protein